MEINNNVCTKYPFTNLSPQDKFEIDGKVFMKTSELTLKDGTYVNAYCLTDNTYTFIENEKIVQKIPPQLKEVPFDSLEIGTAFLKHLTPYLKMSETTVLCLKTCDLDSCGRTEIVTPVKSVVTLSPS